MDSFFEVEQSDIQETEESTPVVAALPENFIEYEIENVKLKFPFRVRRLHVFGPCQTQFDVNKQAYDSQISMMERVTFTGSNSIQYMLNL